MDAKTLINESVADKFMRYVQVDTTSSELSDETPSTPQQWDLARMLEAELEAMRLEDVELDEHCFVLGRLPASPGVTGPPIGLVAHIDTVSGIPGSGVTPVLHRSYGGGPIQVGNGVVLDPADSPALAGAVGCDIVTSDGSTLLGADDKAGIADIMRALAILVNDASIPRPDVWVCFTPDEETGKGVLKFPYDRFKAKIAYTFDGGELGELSDETFNAVNGTVTIAGRSVHPGSARGKMVNALHLAGEVLGSIPAGWRPETTSEREGFIHPTDIEGNVEQVKIKMILRDFDQGFLEAKEAALVRTLAAIQERYPGASVRWDGSMGYRNMKAELNKDPRVVKMALRAMEMAGIRPVIKPIRGGTDGARMTFNGVLTPNIFTGGGDAHSRREWACVQWMEKAAEVAVNLARLWAQETQ